MVYKIAFDGAHHIGKSSIAKIVAGILGIVGVNAIYLEEMSTEASERGLPINRETNLAAQRYILHRQFAEELRFTDYRKTGPNYQVIACDRGPANYCYLEHNVGPDQETLNMILDHHKKFPYDRIHYLPVIDREISVGAGTRDLDKQFQLDMEKDTLNFLKEYFSEQLVEHSKPEPNDPNRTSWIEGIVNKTMEDLNREEKIKLDIKWLNTQL
ncbi:hypothetical protein HON71_05925 [Candidatus Woesearchaeota archaeon]|jgi:hypothetical protein|nr:hypothetical protein [Candidatus Woesearchaeota archaeon]MBT5342471.1 hypothetical protein [Candidatus Woesearchaeota archaeon]